MNDELNKIKNNVKNLIQDKFLPVIKTDFDNLEDFVNNIKNTQQEFDSLIKNQSDIRSIEFLSGLNNYQQKTNELINAIHKTQGGINFDDKFSDYNQSINSFFEELEDFKIIFQDDERFSQQKDDKLKIKFYKVSKNLALHFTHLPLHISNSFREIFKKPLTVPKNWKHTIPYRRLAFNFLRDEFIEKFSGLIKTFYLMQSEVYLKLWKLDENVSREFFKSFEESLEKIDIDFNSAATELNELLDSIHESGKNFKDEIIKSINDCFEDFEKSIKIAGTLELPSRDFNSNKIQKKHNIANKTFLNSNRLWGNTYFALFDDWRVNKEIYIVTTKTFIKQISITERANSVIRENILPGTNQIKNQLVKIKDEIKNYKSSNRTLLKYLTSERETVTADLNKEIIPKIIEAIYSKNITAYVDEVELAVRANVNETSKKRALAEKNSYTSELRDSEIDFISPQELITFDKLPNLISQISIIKNNVVSEIEQVQNGLNSLNDIIDFNLESAIAAFENEKQNNENKAKEIAIEGIERAIEKSSEIEFHLENIIKQIKIELGNALNKFKDDIFELTNNEKVLNIKIKLAKAKAFERAGALRKDISDKIQKPVPAFAEALSKRFLKSKKLFKHLKEKFGLVPPHRFIASEISDYLTETNSAIQKLPFVYQRLFQVEALSDERFFYGRDKELNKLSDAYMNWKKGYFAPVAIVGEKGSGITSLINVFINKSEADYKIRRISFRNNINTEKEFFVFISNFFESNEFHDSESLINYLLSLRSKQIVLIENLQKMFLKKVNGFAAIHIFLEIISRTNKNIFWVTSSTYFGWHYLDKIMNVADNFGYVIKLQNLQEEEIIEIINKRHRVSGYKINFESTINDNHSKSFKKLNETEQQNILQREYFINLNKFAGSNTTLALLFWLSSTKEVTHNTIKIKSDIDFDFSFLNSLSINKLFTLQSLLIHDGLSEESLASILSISNTQSKSLLLILLNDGIVVQNENTYLINPFLYRQIVNLLNSKNIIH